MQITWHGQTCFKIITQKEKNGQVVILIDPFEKEVGLRAPKTEADVLLSTQLDKKISPENYFLIAGPGEYDLKGIYIQGIPVSKNIIYTIESEDLKICHLGLLGQKDLTPEQLETIGDIDILMVPVGGGEALDSEGAVKIISRIEPKITIPMYYHLPGLKLKLGGVDKFLKVLGIKSLAPLPKLTLKKKDISEEEAKIVVLES